MMEVGQKKVLVTGAAGGVGGTISGILKEKGYSVRGFIRPEDDNSKLRKLIGAENISTGYVEDPGAVFEAMQGIHTVINCAALLPGALHLGEEAFNRVNVLGALNILDQASKLNIKNLVFFSTISVVDHITRKISQAQIQEYIAYPHDAYLSSKINLEKELDKRSKSYPGQISIIRPAFIYGPGNFSVWLEGLKLVMEGKMVLIGDGNALLPLIYAEDIARFTLLLLDGSVEKPDFGIYVLSSPEQTTMKQVFNFIADYAGGKRPLHVPYWPLFLASMIVGLLPEKLKMGRLKILTKARVMQYSRGYDLSGVITPPPLGFVPITKYEEGMSKMLDEYKKIQM